MAARECGCQVRQRYEPGLLPRLEPPTLVTDDCDEHGVVITDEAAVVPSFARLLALLVVFVVLFTAVGVALVVSFDPTPDELLPHQYLRESHVPGSVGR